MSSKPSLIVLAVLLAVIAGCAAPTRVGQSATVQFGTVRSADRVTLDSTAAEGAIVGGMLGLVGGRSSSNTRNAITGAALGGASRAAAEGSREGMAYTVEMLDGSSVRIITDQREIRPGDCVAIERVRDSANVRRASESFCDAANERAVREVEGSVRTDAVECQAAKQELADASSAEAADLAARKVELLCNS